jgi:hypothetical protein
MEAHSRRQQFWHLHGNCESSSEVVYNLEMRASGTTNRFCPRSKSHLFQLLFEFHFLVLRTDIGYYLIVADAQYICKCRLLNNVF